MADPILLARHGATEALLLPALANRHGLITGATGTGKTITLQKLAEGLSRQGVPVFMADIKGDLTGISQTGRSSPKLEQVLRERGLEAPDWGGCPTLLWDVFGEQGHPVRATVSDMARCCWRACSTSTRRSRACCSWSSASPTTAACCCST